jgi:transposase
MNQQPTPTYKSTLIRQLYQEGKKPSEIARQLKTHYSYVHGVIKRFKEQGEPIAASERPSKSRKIRELRDAGKSVAEIRTELQLDYAFVYGVVKRYEENKRKEVEQNGSES